MYLITKVTCSPCSLLPTPYSLLPRNLYLTQLKTAIWFLCKLLSL
ncbi:hypothetical protein [Moorena sp. SIO3I6]|nr:hypothetical protein [Moorena sp. SIO3I6]